MTMLASLRAWAASVNRDALALWLAARDTRTPWYAKALAILVAAYAFSPIDLIPDFIPVLGYLDDLLLVPLGVAAVVALIPDELMAEFRAEANKRRGRPTSSAGAIGILLLWVAVAVGIIWAAWGYLS